MNPENQNANPGNEPVDEKPVDQKKDRRKALIEVGKFAAYAAPFTVLALTNKAEAATGHGPGKQTRH